MLTAYQNCSGMEQFMIVYPLITFFYFPLCGLLTFRLLNNFNKPLSVLSIWNQLHGFYPSITLSKFISLEIFPSLNMQS